jgi:hypothetical protein
MKTNHLIMAVLFAASLTSSSNGLAQTNLIVNGNFAQGNVGFTSQYTYAPNGWTQSGSYAVGNNPANYNNSYWGAVSFGPYDPSGLMMVCDGATSSGVVAWQESVQVQQNTEYDFAAWVASPQINDIPPNPLAELAINGIDMNTFEAPSTSGTWEEWAVSWNSGNDTMATIQVTDLNTQALANDFCLDALSLEAEAVPEPTSLSMLGVAFAGMMLFLRSRAGVTHHGR